MSTPARPPANGSRGFLRFLLGGLAAQMLYIGVLASVAPHWFFGWFPFGRGWAGKIGPYSEHYVIDLGFTFLGLGVVVLWATIRPTLALARAAAAGSILANAPHLFYHLDHIHVLGLWDNVAQDGILVAATVAGIAVLLLLWQKPGAAEVPSAAELKPVARPLSIAGVGGDNR